LANVFAAKVTISEAASVTVTSLSGNFSQIGNSIRAAIYADNAGAPSTLLVESNRLDPSGNGWTQLDIPDKVLAPGVYWLALQTLSGTISSMIRYDSGTGNIEAGTAAYAFGPFPSTFSVYAYGSFQLSLVANYCQPAGPTPTPTNSFTMTPTPTKTTTPIFTETPVCGSTFSAGYNAIGSSTSALANVFAAKVTIAEAASVTVTSLSGNFSQIGSSMRAAIYSDNSGVPSTLLVESNRLDPSGSGWTQLDIPDTVLAPGVYWLALQTLSGTISSMIRYDSGTGNIEAGTAAYAFGPFPSTFSVYAYGSFQLSLVANYCQP
jgi:hypothetical protein